MARYSSHEYEPKVEWHVLNKKAKELLFKCGVHFEEGLLSTGVPQIHLLDLTKPHGEPLDFEPFKGRIRLRGSGAKLNCGPYGPFPIDTVRLTIVRWGTAPDQIGEIDVGAGTELNGTSICSYASVRIGEGVLLGPGVVIMDADGHQADGPDVRPISPSGCSPVVIGDRSWIGLRATILKGVRIGRGCRVAAGAVVTKSVHEGGAVAGNPAVVVRE